MYQEVVAIARRHRKTYVGNPTNKDKNGLIRLLKQ